MSEPARDDLTAAPRPPRSRRWHRHKSSRPQPCTRAAALATMATPTPDQPMASARWHREVAQRYLRSTNRPFTSLPSPGINSSPTVNRNGSLLLRA